MLIRDVFNEFLHFEEINLSPKTYRESKNVIELFAHCLQNYAWNSLDNGDKAYDKTIAKNLTFADVYEHTYILNNVGEFLNYFVPRKVMAGDNFVLKTCPRVIKKLLTWMKNNNLLDIKSDEIKYKCEGFSSIF